MRKIFLILALFIFAFLCLAQNKTVPVLFAPNVVNSGGDDYNPSFTSDGKTVYFTRRKDRKGSESIMVSSLKNGKWQEPQIAPFSGEFYDKEPFVSPDGRRIFFASTRPNKRDEKNNFDIWFVEKTKDGWNEPVNLGDTVNSAGYDNYPSVAADGTIYFASVRVEGRKDNDLYRSRLVNGKYQKAENLGDAINTGATEADPFIAPDQSYLIFCSDRAGSESEEGDLYISFNRGGKWTVPQNLGKIVNTADYEYTPLVSPDGKTFYFSRGWGDIYEIDFAALNLPALKQSAKDNSPKTDLAIYTGEYQIAPDNILIVTAENETLFGMAKGRKAALKSVAADRFEIAEANVQMTFIKDADGKISHLILVENGRSVRANKIK